MVESLQKGDVSGVTQGLQQMAQSGQLDVSKLASDLGVSGAKNVDLGAVATSLTGGGNQANTVLNALGKQGGGAGDLLKGAAGMLKSPAGLAVGGAALAGAGYLFQKSRKGGGGGGLGDALGSVMGGGKGGSLGAMLGGDAPAEESEDQAQLNAAAQQLPEPTPDQLKEGQAVLARWSGREWRTGRIGWVDGGQARVTFDSGFERWCDPREIRLPPTPGQPVGGAPQASALPSVGSTVEALVDPERWYPGQVVEVDAATGRVMVRFENGYQQWYERAQIRP